MPSGVPRCRITVVKRTLNHDLIEEYLADEYSGLGPCESFSDGQEFVLEGFEELASVPEGFCPWA